MPQDPPPNKNHPAPADTSAAKSTPTPELEDPAQLLLKQFPAQILGQHSQHGDDTLLLHRDAMLDAFKCLKDNPAASMEMMVDITAVDWLPRQPRFEVVYHFKSISLGNRIRIKIPLTEDDAWVHSIIPLWPAADWYERECWEMYGIVFKEHPNLKALLLYDGFEGYPLRKDYQKTLAQPLVEMRPVRERYDYQERFQPVKALREKTSDAAADNPSSMQGNTANTNQE